MLQYGFGKLFQWQRNAQVTKPLQPKTMLDRGEKPCGLGHDLLHPYPQKGLQHMLVFAEQRLRSRAMDHGSSKVFHQSLDCSMNGLEQA